MRACTKCGETKPLEAFPPVRRGEEKRQSWCRDCFAEANGRNYQRNHEREKARLLAQTMRNRTENRLRMISFLQEHPCVDCSESDIVVLEFEPSFWQDGRRRDADRARQYMDSHLWRDAQVRGSVRKLSSPKDRRAMARNRETADPSITSASRTAASRSAGQKDDAGSAEAISCSQSFPIGR